MKKFLSTLVAVLASLGLVAGPAMAAQAYLLSDTELAGIWAGENTNTADNTSTATQVPIHDNLNDNSVAFGGTNAANEQSNVSDNPDGIAAIDATVSDSLGADSPNDSALANNGSTAARQNAQTGSGNLSDNPSNSAVAQDDSQAANNGGTVIDAEIDDIVVALDGDVASDGSTIDNSTNVDVEIDDIVVAFSGNAASDGSTAADIIVQQTVSESQNSANGINLSNALLSQIAQQSNVLSVSGDGSPHKVIQVNFNRF